MGDLGNPFAEEHLEALRDQVDVVLALAGGFPTIALDDLVSALAVIRPRVVIPMHYRIPRIRGRFGRVDDFLAYYDSAVVTQLHEDEIELRAEDLPAPFRVYVLEPSC